MSQPGIEADIQRLLDNYKKALYNHEAKPGGVKLLTDGRIVPRPGKSYLMVPPFY